MTYLLIIHNETPWCVVIRFSRIRRRPRLLGKAGASFSTSTMQWTRKMREKDECIWY